MVTEKTSTLVVPEKAKWVWSFPQKGPLPENCHYLNWQLSGKNPFSGLVFIRPNSEITQWKNSSPSTFVENNCLTMEMPEAAIPVGWGERLTGKLGEWDVHGRIWKALTYSLDSRRPHTCAALCACTTNTWEDPNLSPLADIEPLGLQQLKATAELSLAWLIVEGVPQHAPGASLHWLKDLFIPGIEWNFCQIISWPLG